MSKFEKIRELNKLPVFHISDEIFSEYGNIINGINADEYIKFCENVEFPESGSVYAPSYAEFENTAESEKIRHTCFGGVPTQIGICYVHNSLLNALEWHICNEVNIALTDMVVIFAKRSEIKNNCISSDKCKAFFVPKGTAIEVYSTTLHYCPCETDENGFAMVVGLTKDTNTELPYKPADGSILIAKNKRLIAHPNSKEVLRNHCYAGIVGENYKIKFC